MTYIFTEGGYFRLATEKAVECFLHRLFSREPRLELFGSFRLLSTNEIHEEYVADPASRFYGPGEHVYEQQLGRRSRTEEAAK
jgi:hypothetical protein